MRLQKYLAQCGVASRRHAEEMIAAGQVTVNGLTVTEMGAQVEDGDAVFVNGKRVRPQTTMRYIMYHKPAGEVTTASDPEGRKTVLSHFEGMGVRLFPVGRLDYDSEGLLLLTNDGELTNRMLHPRNEVDKTYLARVSGELTNEALRQLRAGVVLDERRTAPARVRVTRLGEEFSYVTVTIHEGRNRQVRRMFEAVGLKVLALKRIGFGPLELGDLPRGKWRELTQEERERLRTLYE
ncbi:MAG: rRNA pseudouridine synthase [Clostridia bacterium]|nr:rRNA pseudouridine synthase [Clostridia bacterium]